MQPNNCFHPDYYPDIFLPFVWSNFEDWRYDDWQDEYHYDDYPQMSHISPHMATIHLHGCKGGGGKHQIAAILTGAGHTGGTNE